MSANENTAASIRPITAIAYLAQSMKEVSVDFIEFENQTLRSRWFHGDEEMDVFIWLNARGRLIKAQANVMGQVVDWNVLNGLRTGMSVEDERCNEASNAAQELVASAEEGVSLEDEADLSVRETIEFDKKIRKGTQSFVLNFMNELKCIEDPLKTEICTAFRGESPLSFMRLSPFSDMLAAFVKLVRRPFSG